MPNLAMRQPATQFSADGLELSWPLGGEREVVAWPEDKMSLRIKRRIAEGSIVIVDDKPTKSTQQNVREYRLLTGEDARKHMAEPAGPVTRIVYAPAWPEDDREYQREVQDVRTDSERFVEAQAAAAEAAEERHAANTKAQIEAEKEAEKAAKEAPEEEPDPIAERIAEANAANAEHLAAQDKAFMEREKERQKEEADTIKSFEAVAKAQVKDEEKNTEADEAFMEAEKARQKEEAKVEKERQKAATAAQKEAEKTPSEGYAGKTDPYVGVSNVGSRAGYGTTSADRSPSAEKVEAKPKTAAPKAEPKAEAKTETKTSDAGK